MSIELINPSCNLTLTPQEIESLEKYQGTLYHVEKTLSSRHKDILVKLEKKLESILSKRRWKTSFIRCGNISLKDKISINPSKKTEALFTSIINTYPTSFFNYPNIDALWLKTISKSLSITCGYDGVKILSRSGSTFLYSEVVSLSKFVNFDPRLSFRAIKSASIITGLTQKYDIYCPYIVKHKSAIEKKILDLLSLVKHKIDSDSCIIDIAIRENAIEKDLNPNLLNFFVLKVNELSPAKTVGLFCWKTEISLIQSGPYSFRVHESPHFEVKRKIVTNAWRDFARGVIHWNRFCKVREIVIAILWVIAFIYLFKLMYNTIKGYN